jgi:hypothetical protein
MTARHLATAAMIWALLVPASSAAAQPSIPFDPVPADELIFGFNQVGSGTGANLWSLTDEELRILTEEIGINAIRIFVHPVTLGFPQQTWAGPEAVVYSTFTDWVWDRPGGIINSFDEMIAKILEFGIYPILLPMTIGEYQLFMYEPDLTFLNVPGVDFTGINPQEEVESYSVAVAQHMRQRFPGVPFGLVFNEICGYNDDNASERGDEKASWQALRDALRVAAPQAEVLGPEVCIGMSWWRTSSAERCQLDPVHYSNDFPFHDFIENYADVFDALTISFFGISQFDVDLQMVHCPSTRIRATTGTHLRITRDNALPKKWLFGEVGWGSETLLTGGMDELHFAWASTLFGLDHSRGLLVWQAKGNEGSGAGIWDFPDFTNEAALAVWRVMGPVINQNAAFLGTYHTQVNGDDLTTDDNTVFIENEATVFTRKLPRHVVIYSEGSLTEVAFSQVGDSSLRLLYSGGTQPSILETENGIVIRNLTPMRLYILQILGPGDGRPQVPGDCNQDAVLDVSDAVCALGVLFTGTPAAFPCGDGTPADPGNRALLDWQPDGSVDLSDAVAILQFLFLNAAAHPLAVPGSETMTCVAIPGCDANTRCP